MDRAPHELEREGPAGAEVQGPLAETGAPSLAHALGNRGFGQFVARMGDGLLPGGAVHPDVASAISAARGSGHGLPDDVRDRVAPHAFTTGTDVFFAAGEYQPGTSQGGSLLAHELTHVAQQRGAPTSGPMTV